MTLLRTHAEGQAKEADDAITALVETARQHGLVILGGESLSMSSDEIRLLAWLASSQRKYDVSIGKIAPDLRSALHACAHAMASSGIRLPYLAIQRIEFLDPDDEVAR